MKIKKVLWILVAVLAVFVVFDSIDGNVPKIISSSAIFIALLFFAIGNGKSGQKTYFNISYIFLIIALLSFTFRLIRFYH